MYFSQLAADSAAVIHALETDALTVIATAPLDAVRLAMAALEFRFAAFRHCRPVALAEEALADLAVEVEESAR